MPKLAALAKFWTWLRTHPVVLFFLVGALAGALGTGAWYNRHPVVKTTIDTTAVDKAVSNYKDQLAAQLLVQQELRDTLTQAQQQIVNLQSQKKIVIHTDKKADGEVVTDETIEEEMEREAQTNTNTNEVKTGDTSVVANNTETKEGQKVDESSIHTTTTITPVKTYDSILIAVQWNPLVLNHGFSFQTNSFTASVQAHVGSVFGIADLYLGPGYQSVPGGLGAFGLAATLGIR